MRLRAARAGRRRRDRRRADSRHAPGARGSGACARSRASRARSVCAAVALDHPIVRHRLAARSTHGHATRSHRMTADRRVDRAAARHHADADRLVLAVDLARGELARRASSAPARCARRPAARSCPCRADARCRRAAASRARGSWCSSAFCSVPVRIAGAGVHDEARRLVDDDDVARPRRRSRARCPARAARRRRRPGRRGRCARRRRRMSRGRGTSAVDAQLPLVDPALEARCARTRAAASASAWSRRRPAACGGNRNCALVTGGTHAGRESVFCPVYCVGSTGRGPVTLQPCRE